MQTAIFAVVAASAILAGAAIGALWDAPDRLRGMLLAFAAGALVTALAFELFEESHRQSGLWWATGALFVGAAVFTFVDIALERRLGGREAVGLALVAAVTLDGVPENLALGVTLVDEGSYALLAAIFASNFPEALGGAASIRAERGPVRALVIWGVVAALLAAAILGGRFLGAQTGEGTTALLLAFAAGAVLASIADTVLPEAFADGGRLIAFPVAAGFVVAYALGG